MKAMLSRSWLYVLLSCKKDDTAEEMKLCVRFFSVATPEKANAS